MWGIIVEGEGNKGNRNRKEQRSEAYQRGDFGGVRFMKLCPPPMTLISNGE